MQTNNKSNDDLDYLSQLGFEKIAVSGREFKVLKKKVRRHFFPGTKSWVLVASSLLVGVFIGLAVFYFIENASVKTASNLKNTVSTSVSEEKNMQVPNIVLDTLEVLNDNFVKPEVKKAVVKRQVAASQEQSDTVEVVTMEPLRVSPLVVNNLTEQKIKFIINSPITYIHDLKVSDYASLYFKKNQFVRFRERSGVSAEYANDRWTVSQSELKQEADYFLHQELADALLDFKRKKYDACIITLSKVNAYNKTDVNCDFYLGMCYFNKKNYAKAQSCFTACIENTNNSFLQEAMYYKAMSMAEQGNKNGAITLLQKIVDEKEFYSEKARIALANL